MKTTRKIKVLALTSAILLALFTIQSAGAADDRKLVSSGVKAAPQGSSSGEWSKAKEANVLLTGAGTFEGKKITIKVKSVHTDDMIYFLFDWPDAEKSMGKKEWSLQGGDWKAKKADEDRLGVIFEINRINKFATKGCAVLCHNESKNEKEWYYAVNSSKEKGDLWHWKSVRSNPAGFTEDGFLIDNSAKKPEAGRKRDAGKGKAKSNKTKDKTKPAFMQDPSKPASVVGSLLTTEAVEITSYEGFTDGTIIPGYMVNPDWTASFADLKTKGVWSDGHWTVFMSRKLNTGNDDDLAFNPKKKYPFAIAVFDNSHEHHSYNSEPLKLQFK
jgi:hypothetical protein